MKTYNEYLLMVENAIAEINYPPRTPELFAPVKYGMESGGKRIRPVLLLATANALGREPESVMNQAVAIEMFHNFTLLHDDVMDNAAVRRGRPSVFKKWGLSEAILSGDAMCTLASDMVMRGQDAETALRLIKAFNGAAIGVYEGQQLDIEFETRTDVTIEEYVEMVRLKTSVLLGAACNLGAIAANASDQVCAAFDDFATNLGIAFQLQDDFLDTFGDPSVFGKAIGGDILNEKKTWLFIQAVSENASAMAEALKLEGQQKIDAVRSVYVQQGLDSRITSVIAEYTEKAQTALMKTGLDEADKSFFTALAQKLTQRNK